MDYPDGKALIGVLSLLTIEGLLMHGSGSQIASPIIACISIFVVNGLRPKAERQKEENAGDNERFAHPVDGYFNLRVWPFVRRDNTHGNKFEELSLAAQEMRSNIGGLGFRNGPRFHNLSYMLSRL